jgi:hypothetical protein
MRSAIVRTVMAIGLVFALGAVAIGWRGEQPEPAPPAGTLRERIEFMAQTRDRKTGAALTRIEKLDPRKVGVIVVDPWNYHWCMTWSEQAGGMVPRLNRALAAARKLGMQVFWAPTDVASMYAGVPQRERALAVPYVAVPRVRACDCPFTVASGPCHCGPGHPCLPNYGHDGMPADIDLAESDFIVSGTQELYSICQQQGLTHLIYTGGAINMCLTGKPEGLKAMHEAGLECLVARDLAEAWTQYDPARGHTPDVGNAAAIVDLERAGIPTVHLVDEWRRLRLWDEDAITEPVRITPAGKSGRPFVFDESVTISLNTPWLNDAEIRYTLDGSAPAAGSLRYERPLELRQTTTVRAAGLRQRRRVSLESSGYFVRLPALPPKPDVYLDQLTPVPDQYAVVNPACAACLWQPKMNQSYEGLALRVRGKKYDKGVGMRTPAYLRYEVKPEWERFVALAGVADNMLDQELGRNIARYPSVVFKIFVDGKLAGESPVMRISQVPWRFDVALPAGARVITLCATDAGDRSPYDLANLVDAGFVRRRE